MQSIHERSLIRLAELHRAKCQVCQAQGRLCDDAMWRYGGDLGKRLVER